MNIKAHFDKYECSFLGVVLGHCGSKSVQTGHRIISKYSKMNGFHILVLGGLLTLVQLSHCNQVKFVDRGIYTFENRAFRGFLTTHLQSPIVDTDAWRDAPSQKFRAVKGYFSTAFMLKPTSEEKDAIYIDERRVSKASSGFGMSSSQYWTTAPADTGFVLIRNAKSDECLESPGLGRKVMTGRCRNIPAQQWSVHSR